MICYGFGIKCARQQHRRCNINPSAYFAATVRSNKAEHKLRIKLVKGGKKWGGKKHTGKLK